MKVEVIVPQFGTREKGDQFDLPDTTAQALIVHKVVKEVKPDKESKEK